MSWVLNGGEKTGAKTAALAGKRPWGYPLGPGLGPLWGFCAPGGPFVGLGISRFFLTAFFVVPLNFWGALLGRPFWGGIPGGKFRARLSPPVCVPPNLSPADIFFPRGGAASSFSPPSSYFLSARQSVWLPPVCFFRENAVVSWGTPPLSGGGSAPGGPSVFVPRNFPAGGGAVF